MRCPICKKITSNNPTFVQRHLLITHGMKTAEQMKMLDEVFPIIKMRKEQDKRYAEIKERMPRERVSEEDFGLVRAMDQRKTRQLRGIYSPDFNRDNTLKF